MFKTIAVLSLYALPFVVVGGAWLTFNKIFGEKDYDESSFGDALLAEDPPFTDYDAGYDDGYVDGEKSAWAARGRDATSNGAV